MCDCSIRLSTKQTKRLKRIYTTESGKVARRAHIVLLRSKGLSLEEIEELCLCDRNTVSETLQRFKTNSYQGLFDKKHEGRNRKLSEEDVQFLLMALRQNPHDFKYYATVWTVALMVKLLKQYRNIVVCASVVSSELKLHNWHFNRPKHISTEYPLKSEEKECIIRLLTNPRPEEVILFGDEADFEWLPYLSGAWMPKGEQLKIPTPGHNKVLCCFGFFNPHTKGFFYKLVYSRSKKTAKNFIAMLHQIRAQFLGRIVHIVLDNASIHDQRTKLLKQFQQTYSQQIIIHFLPKQTPILNPIERFWRFLKMRICANYLYNTLDALKNAFRGFIWRYREHQISYNFSLSTLIDIWKNHPIIEQTRDAV